MFKYPKCSIAVGILLGAMVLETVLWRLNERPLGVESAFKDPTATIFARAGFTVEVIAAEDLIQSPVAFAWGPDGRFWVVEMIDYPLGLDGRGKPGGRVKCLEDIGPDGKYSKASVFLDGLSFPTSVLPWRNGVLVACAPDILYAEDTDGDGKADVCAPLYTGFGQGNVQHRANSLVWGLDNWVYGANGDSGGTVKSLKTGQVVHLEGRDFRIRPDTGDIDAQSGQSQFGRNRDDWGNWFGCNNRNPMWHFVLADHYIRRNPHFAPPDPRKRVSVMPNSGAVFPTGLPQPRYNEPESLNHFTSACSAMVYRDELFGTDFLGNAFVSEPAHNLVHRELLSPDGYSFKGQRAADEQKSEFLVSTDSWFRPTTIQTAPDGTLWIADMHRKVIEHPEWIPEYYHDQLDFRAGHDKGRIYRVYPTGVKPRPIPRLDRLDTTALAEALDSPNGWQRDMAQQLLLWRNNSAAVPVLERMALTAVRPLVRLHALCTLEGLGCLGKRVLERALADPHPGVRRHAIRLCEPHFDREPELGRIVSKLVIDDDPQVRLQLACSVGEWHASAAGELLAQIVLRDPGNSYLVAGAMSALTKQNLPAVLSALLPRCGSPDAAVSNLAEEFFRQATAIGDPDALVALLPTVCRPEVPGDYKEWQFRALAGILDSLDERQMSLTQLCQTKTAKTDELAGGVTRIYAAARGAAINPRAQLSKRRRAVRLLGRRSDRHKEDLQVLGDLLLPGNEISVQRAALGALAQVSEPSVACLLLSSWKSYLPALRGDVIDTLLRREEWGNALFEAVRAGQVLTIEIDLVRRERLFGQLRGPNRELATTVFKERIADRQKVIAEHRRALALPGDRFRGAQVFAQICSSCHRLNGVGQAVGPELNSMRGKTSATLLEAILDPNRVVEARYLSYMARTRDGRSFAGVLAFETSNSITLIEPGGKEHTISRERLEDLSCTGKSAMPEGLEKNLSDQDLADVIDYLRQAS